MYFRLMGKLNARRNGLLSEEEKGFTLIELLVVVIIIGILAAIAIPVYLGVQNNARNSAVKSDVTNLKTALVSVETSTGSLPTVSGTSQTFTGLSALKAYPSANPDDLATAGATFSADDTGSLIYTPDGSGGFCIEGDSKTGGHQFHATDTEGVTDGGC